LPEQIASDQLMLECILLWVDEEMKVKRMGKDQGPIAYQT